jgi:hypothetical protein
MEYQGKGNWDYLFLVLALLGGPTKYKETKIMESLIETQIHRHQLETTILLK